MTTLQSPHSLTVNSIDESYLAHLHTAANHLLQNGFSVIPIYGDLSPGDFAKVPPIRWGDYQKRLPTLSNTREWFINRGYGGLAVIAGKVSRNLFFIDFDRCQWVAQFEFDFPDFLDTAIMLSGGRKLPHYWFIAPVNETVTFHGQTGAVELRGEGQYVVAPPTRINGGSYVTIRSGEPKHLTPEQYKRLLLWFDAHFGTSHENASEHETISRGDAVHLITTFTKLVQKLNSRNKAAFVTLCWARDNEWLKQEAREALRTSFVDCLPVGQHVLQTPGERGKEFDATLRSVYGIPPRKRLASGIPTLLREYLLKRKLGKFARVLDCLVMCGWLADKSFTEADAVRECAHHGISRPTVHAALNVTLGNVLPISSTGSLDVTKVPSNRNALVFNAKDSRNFDYTQIRGKNIKLFHMPNITELCSLLGVTRLSSDVLPFEALSRISSYRAGITHALIQRKPQRYRQQMLARRVGVCARSIRKIIKRDKTIKTTPCYQETIITADNLNSYIIADSNEMRGHYLDVEGKPFRPLPEIAQQKLRAGYKVKLIKRLANHYEIQPEIVVPPASDFATEIGIELGLVIREVPVIEQPTSSLASPFIQGIREYAEISLKREKVPVLEKRAESL